MEIELTIKGYQCERCNHKWIPRMKNCIPINCPSCNSGYWNRPKKRNKLKDDRNKNLPKLNRCKTKTNENGND